MPLGSTVWLIGPVRTRDMVAASCLKRGACGSERLDSVRRSTHFFEELPT